MKSISFSNQIERAHAGVNHFVYHSKNPWHSFLSAHDPNTGTPAGKTKTESALIDPRRLKRRQILGETLSDSPMNSKMLADAKEQLSRCGK